MPKFQSVGCITADTWSQKKRLLYEEGRDTCEVFVLKEGSYDTYRACGAPMEDADHGIFHTRSKFKKWVDDIVNLQPSCAQHNRIERIPNQWWHRVMFAQAQCKRYTQERVLEWLERAPRGIKRTDEYDRIYNIVNYGG